MRTAVIKNGIVENIIIADSSIYSELGNALDATLVNIDNVTQSCGIGYSYDGTNFSAPSSEENLGTVIDVLTGMTK